MTMSHARLPLLRCRLHAAVPVASVLLEAMRSATPPSGRPHTPARGLTPLAAEDTRTEGRVRQPVPQGTWSSCRRSDRPGRFMPGLRPATHHSKRDRGSHNTQSTRRDQHLGQLAGVVCGLQPPARQPTGWSDDVCTTSSLGITDKASRSRIGTREVDDPRAAKFFTHSQNSDA
jgi:hypothetical protein